MTSTGFSLPEEGPSSDTAEIVRLIETLRATDQRLDELLGREVDTVTDRDGMPIVLRRAQQQLRTSEHTKQAAILSALPANVALLDSQGVITSTNTAWQRFGDANALHVDRHGVGLNYLDVCDAAQGDDASEAAAAAAAAAGIRSVLNGEVNNFELEYPCHSPMQQRWFRLSVAPVAHGPLSGAVVKHTDITKRIEAAAVVGKLALQTERRERLLNTALSNINDFAYVFDQNGRFLFVNKPLLDLWGIKLEQAIGKDFFDLGYPPEMARRLSLQIAEVFATGKNVSGETSYINPLGTRGCYDYTFSPSIGPDGQVDLVVGCTRNVTERQRILQELEASERHQRELADQLQVERLRLMTAQEVAKVGSWETDLKSMRIIWSDETYRIFERDPATFVTSHESFLGLVHPEDRTRVEEAFVLGRTDDLKVEYRIALPGNRIKFIEARWKVLYNGITPVRAVGTNQDITERKRSEQEMERALERLKNAQSIGQMGDWEWNIATKAITWSPQLFEILGRDPRLGPPKDYTECFDIASQALIKQNTALALSSGEAQCYEAVTRKANGDPITVVVRTLAHHDIDGKLIGLYGTMQDISDRKRDRDSLRKLNAELEDRVRIRTAELNLMRNDAERANLAKSDFLASMSHEIRTPMGGMLGLLELLELSGLSPEQHATLGVARESGRVLLRIIDDILDFSKIEANGLELDLVAASVPVIIRNVCRLHSQIASAKNIALHVEVSEEISPFLSFDPLRLTQILNNFLSNAIKFTAKGAVHVGVELEGRGNGNESLRFTVRDTGIGMSSEQLSRLFKPFVQAGPDTSARFGGTGLGLVISRRLAELMGGTVAIASEAEQGTTLTLSLNMEICEVGQNTKVTGITDRQLLDALMSGRRTAPSKEDAQAEGTLLLIVDDHPTNRMVIMRQVALLGYAAEEAVDGVQALTAWKTGRFGAVITDCNMPRMNGYELAVLIRKEEVAAKNGRTPIIACTANAMTTATELCVSAGMDDCLIKPADLADVSQMLDRWLPLSNCESKAVEAAALPNQRLRFIPSKAEGLLDLILLAEISGGNPLVQAEILSDFRRVNEADAHALRKAAASANRLEVTAFAHRIKGAALMLGSTLLTEACAGVETAAGDPGSLIGAFEVFETELLRLNNFLDDFSSVHSVENAA